MFYVNIPAYLDILVFLVDDLQTSEQQFMCDCIKLLNIKKRARRGNIFLSLYKIPMYRDILDFMAAMCCDQDNFSSISTPRNRATDFCSIFTFAILGLKLYKSKFLFLVKSYIYFFPIFAIFYPPTKQQFQAQVPVRQVYTPLTRLRTMIFNKRLYKCKS